MADLPTGTVTFLFTDLEGSTRLWEEHPEEMKAALARHDEIVRGAIEEHGGSRRVFESLGVFAGAFDADATAAIVADAELDPWDALDAVAGLVDKSMVVNEEGDGSSTRYTMLETLRQYARERLEARGDADAVRLRHAEHYVRFAEEAGPGLCGAGERQWAVRLREELPNVRAAAVWALDRQAPEEAALALRIIAG